MKFLPLLWAGLWRRRTRTVLTLLSVVIAFLLFGLLQGVNSWLSNAIAESRVNRLYTVSRISFIEPMPEAYGYRVTRGVGAADDFLCQSNARRSCSASAISCARIGSLDSRSAIVRATRSV